MMSPPIVARARLSKVPIRKYSANRGSLNSGKRASAFAVRISPTRAGACIEMAVTARKLSSQPM